MRPSRPALLIAVAVCLPLLAMPWLISLCPPERTAETLLWIYPFAVVAGACLAYRSRPERPEVFWILIAVIILIHLSMWVLVDPLSVTTLMS